MIFTMLIVAVVSCVFLLTGCGEKKEIYVNDTFGFSVVMPKEFAVVTKIKEEGNVIYFKAENLTWENGDKYMPTIGRIEVYDKDKYTPNQILEMTGMYNLKILEVSQQYYFGVAHATDVQIMPGSSQENLEEFRKLEAVFDQVMDTFEQNP